MQSKLWYLVGASFVVAIAAVGIVAALAPDSGAASASEHEILQDADATEPTRHAAARLDPQIIQDQDADRRMVREQADAWSRGLVYRGPRMPPAENHDVSYDTGQVMADHAHRNIHLPIPATARGKVMYLRVIRKDYTHLHFLRRRAATTDKPAGADSIEAWSPSPSSAGEEDPWMKLDVRCPEITDLVELVHPPEESIWSDGTSDVDSLPMVLTLAVDPLFNATLLPNNKATKVGDLQVNITAVPAGRHEILVGVFGTLPSGFSDATYFVYREVELFSRLRIQFDGGAVFAVQLPRDTPPSASLTDEVSLVYEQAPGGRGAEATLLIPPRALTGWTPDVPSGKFTVSVRPQALWHGKMAVLVLVAPSRDEYIPLDVIFDAKGPAESSLECEHESVKANKAIPVGVRVSLFPEPRPEDDKKDSDEPKDK